MRTELGMLTTGSVSQIRFSIGRASPPKTALDGDVFGGQPQRHFDFSEKPQLFSCEIRETNFFSSFVLFCFFINKMPYRKYYQPDDAAA